MRIYAKAVVFCAKEIPDGLTPEQIEEVQRDFETDIRIDLDNLHYGGSEESSYYYEHDDVDKATAESLQEEDKYQFERLKEQIEN